MILSCSQHAMYAERRAVGWPSSLSWVTFTEKDMADAIP